MQIFERTEVWPHTNALVICIPGAPGPGNNVAGLLTFQIWKPCYKSPVLRVEVLVKFLLKAPGPRRLTIMWNNS